MFRKLVLTLALVIASVSVGAKEVNRQDPYQMIVQVSDQTFARLKAEQTQIQQDPERLKLIVEQELMPYVDEKYAALKLLGPNLKGAKREDVLVFIDAFRAYIVASYAQVLTQYTDQTIEFEPEGRVDDSRTITGVKLEIIDSPRPNIKLEFKLRKDKSSGEWSAFDMIAEGISMLSSKQSEWSGKLRQEGILAVAKELQTLAKTPIRYENKS
ncbi:phospholipid-binding protein MlaC [Vibrio scophthalmi]|uniref:phospholipid-binding protein MlaC n=1 Tax=Vibrio scophthalmi TaxID=45658 RepID=UPI002FF13703